MADFEIAFSDEVQELPAPVEKEEIGLEPGDIDSMLMEIRNQPAWRIDADAEADYYDGNQLDQETLDLYEERGQAPIITNLIKPTIDVVLGMEAKTRTDWKVNQGDLTDEDATAEVAEALSAKLHKAESESRADRACSDAYAHQVKVGLGWVEVSRESNPFTSSYRVKSVHRREMWWDWRAVEPDYSDARYMIRRKWYDEDVLGASFPQHKDTIKQLLGGQPAGLDMVLNTATGLGRALDVIQGSSIEQYEYLNTQRKRACLYEIWYKRMVNGFTMKLPNGKVVEFDSKNPRHVAAVESGMLELTKATFLKMRVAYSIGAFILYDGASPYRHQDYPYVPMLGFREDRTGIPYGLIRAMKSPQDEVNSRKSKMYALLNTRGVIADGDAVKDHNKAAREVSRHDYYIQLDENRKSTSKFEIKEGGQLADQQYKVMMEAKEEINQAAGVYQSMMGQTSSTTAASAIANLVEQGTTTLAEINDNYRFGRRKVGELLLEMVKEDCEGKAMRVRIEDGIDKKTIVLNVPAIDPETGEQILQNDVSKANVVVAIEDINQSATYRQQQYAQLVELTKSMPPQTQALIIDFVLEASDQPNRKKMAERIRKVTGISDDPEGQNPQLQQMQELMQQQQAQLQQLMSELEQAKKAIADKSVDQELQRSAQDIQKRADALQARIDAEKLVIEREKIAQGSRDKLQAAQVKQMPTERAA